MKRRTIRWIVVTILLCAVSAGATYGILYWRYTVPLSQCSEVYQRYHDTPGIRASFIRDMPVNDTLSLDVTLLEAVDSASFAELLKSTGKSEDFVRVMTTIDLENDNQRFTGKEGDRVYAIFPKRKVVAYFESLDDSQKKQVIDKNLRETLIIN